MIVGALEYNWGSMRVEYLHPSNPDTVETIYVYTDDYIDCFEQVFTEWTLTLSVYCPNGEIGKHNEFKPRRQ